MLTFLKLISSRIHLVASVFIIFSGSSAMAQSVPEGYVPEGSVYCAPGGTTEAAPICFDSTPCKTIDGREYCLSGTTKRGAITLSDTCWSKQRLNTCYTSENDCNQYSSDSSCTKTGSSPTTLENGELLAPFVEGLGNLSNTVTYSCTYPGRSPTESYNTPGNCDISGFQNGLTWNAPSKSAAGDFLLAVAAQETARQAAVYGNKDGSVISNLFPGSAQRCKTGYGGLKNCCRSSGGGLTTNASAAKRIGLQAGMSAFTYGAKYAAAAGSALVSDTVLANAPQFLQPGLGSMFESAAGLGSAGIGAFGFGTTASSAAGFFASNASSSLIGQSGIYFNPYAFAAAIAVQVVMDIVSCSEEERGLAQARQQDLCRATGSYCSRHLRILGKNVACLERTQTFCCFNGQLGKAINGVANIQYRRGGSCQGISLDQLAGLNFDSPEMQRALQPFMSQVMKNYESGAGKWTADGSLAGAAQGNANAGNAARAQALCQQRKKIYPDTVCN